MKKLILLTLLCFSINGFAETIVSCKSPKGYSFVLPGPFVPEQNSGWVKDGISNGKYSLVKVNGEIDVLFIDAYEEIISARADGGTVIALGLSENKEMFSVLVNYENNAVEIFTFDIKNNLFLISGHKYGSKTRIKKSFSMVGNCN
ncbi:MAG: hypothetical protein CBC42_04680 [Betaproteobacteria bacterium TMED82]|nr:MAG: hypothetical protein CBC42_04680 [Betaproteobacteria bacterium TMED82]